MSIGQSARRPAQLLIVGDSISLGATEVFGSDVLSRAPESYVDQLRSQDLARVIKVDAAVRRTTRDAVALLPALLERHHPDLVLLTLGGNDADIDWKRFIVSKGERVRHNVPVEVFETNLIAFIEIARRGGATPMLSDLPSVDLAARGKWLETRANGASVVAMIDASGGQPESDRRLATYQAAIERLVIAQGVTLVRWAAALEALPPGDRFGPDAIHPGDAAHATIARVIGEALTAADANVPLRASAS